ncbi:Putative transmembrane family 234 [Cinara cedri]|uniref:Transmembrane family 234 n=1 Tax=Cinara cedri TaxID=506608 RepID=A0A5E4MBV4_9HEMI|nr:Putative transmembrane family 234 [Cinara cedri]
MYSSILQLFLVGIVWGVTNPFIKLATNKVKRRNKKFDLVSQVTDHLNNRNYLIPFAINQCGSLLFYFTLKNSDISLAVPIANGMSFVSTSIVGPLLGEEKPKFRTLLGILFLLFGIFCFVIDKKL